MPTSFLMQVSLQALTCAQVEASFLRQMLLTPSTRSSPKKSFQILPCSQCIGRPAGGAGTPVPLAPSLRPRASCLSLRKAARSPGQPLAHEFKRGTPCTAHADFKGKQDQSIRSREERASIIFMWHFKGGGSEAAGDKGRRRG